MKAPQKCTKMITSLLLLNPSLFSKVDAFPTSIHTVVHDTPLTRRTQVGFLCLSDSLLKGSCVTPGTTTSSVRVSAHKIGDDFIRLTDSDSVQRRSFLSQIASLAAILPSSASQAIDETGSAENGKTTLTESPFHSAAYELDEYTNSIVASRDTNISPKEVYDTISSDYLKEAYDAALKERGVGGSGGPKALDVGAGAGVSTEVLYKLGYHQIDALDWSGSAWQKYVIDDASGNCPDGVTFYELDDERFLDIWRTKHELNQQSSTMTSGIKDQDGLFDVIVFNFAVNESKANLFAKELLNKNHGRLLAPINTMNDYWLKQTYQVIDSNGNILWSAADVGAWSVQFQPDVTQDTCSGIWCAPFNGFQKKR